MASTTLPRPFGLFVVRAALGLLATRQGWSWTRADAAYADLLDGAGAGRDAWGLVAWWWEHVATYNPDASGFLLAWGTLIAGVACTLGLLTRPAASVLAFCALHVALYGPDVLAPGAWLATAAAVACAVARAGWVGGLDRGLDGQLPAWLTWVRSGRSGANPF